MLCQDCPEHKTCTKLCEKAEKNISKGCGAQANH